MSAEPQCPKCNSQYTYADSGGHLWVCPECAHEWSRFEQESTSDSNDSGLGDSEIKDANGNVLADGDSVTVLKDLKIKGSSSVVKGGTKVRNIRLLTDAVDGHDIACKIDGIGSINLKSQFVKKA